MLMLIFISILGTSMAQVWFLGSCPQSKSMEGFDIGRYLGKWYEAERYFDVFQVGGKCVSLNYSVGADPNTVIVLNQQENTISRAIDKTEGTAKLAPNGKWVVRYPNVQLMANYWLMHNSWILDTDYDNYAVVWSCLDVQFFNTRNVWILTRERNPSAETMEKAYAVADKNSIDKSYLIKTDQKDCPEDM